MNLIYKLKILLKQTGYEILEKEQIKYYFPILNGYVDLILSTEQNFICFKDFWTYNNLTIDIINNYNVGSNQINTNINTNKKFVFILLNKYLNKKNQLFSNKNLLTIYDLYILEQNKIYVLEQNNMDKLFKKISQLFYSNNIYFFDNDKDLIMLE